MCGVCVLGVILAVPLDSDSTPISWFLRLPSGDLGGFLVLGSHGYGALTFLHVTLCGRVRFFLLGKCLEVDCWFLDGKCMFKYRLPAQLFPVLKSRQQCVNIPACVVSHPRPRMLANIWWHRSFRCIGSSRHMCSLSRCVAIGTSQRTSGCRAPFHLLLCRL